MGIYLVLWVKSIAFIIYFAVDIFNYGNRVLKEYGEGLRPTSLILGKRR